MWYFVFKRIRRVMNKCWMGQPFSWTFTETMVSVFIKLHVRKVHVFSPFELTRMAILKQYSVQFLLNRWTGSNKRFSELDIYFCCIRCIFKQRVRMKYVSLLTLISISFFIFFFNIYKFTVCSACKTMALQS